MPQASVVWSVRYTKLLLVSNVSRFCSFTVVFLLKLAHKACFQRTRLFFIQTDITAVDVRTCFTFIYGLSELMEFLLNFSISSVRNVASSKISQTCSLGSLVFSWQCVAKRRLASVFNAPDFIWLMFVPRFVFISTRKSESFLRLQFIWSLMCMSSKVFSETSDFSFRVQINWNFCVFAASMVSFVSFGMWSTWNSKPCWLLLVWV